MTTTEITTSDQLIAAFTESGEGTVLGAFADSLDEQGRLPELAALCREVMDDDTDVVLFFLRNAGWGWLPGRESQAEGKLRGALDLARAEVWYQLQREEGTGWVEWELDDTAMGEDEDDGPKWYCVVIATVDGKEVSSGLFSIDLGWDGPSDSQYSRVVEAELAQQLAVENGVKI